MTSRQRVLAAVQHRQPDRVPLFYRDIPEVGQRLQRDLGLPDRESLLRKLGIDFRWVAARYVGPSLLNEETGTRRDIWGVEHRFIPASAGGNWEPVTHPLSGVVDPAALKDYPWPTTDLFDFSELSAQLDNCRGYAVMTGPGIDSPSVLLYAQFLVGMERSLMDMVLNPKFCDALIEQIATFFTAYVEKFFAVAGDRVDFFRMGEDFGTQRGLLMSPLHYRRFVQPALRAIASIAKRRGARYYHHSCGAVRDLIPDLVETGVDVLDPVQVKAAGMEPAGLKRDFPALCFSGGVDEQELLPRGTPAQVRAGVRALLDVMAPGGGFFIGPTHNLQADIPTENVLAMYEEAQSWRG